MKYKLKYWNDSRKDFLTLEYPFIETALMMAHKIAHKTHTPVFITDGTIDGTIVIEGRL